MGKLKLVSFLYLIFSLLSCKENSFIVIKNKGELSQNIYRNKNYNICNTSTFIYKSDIDTIRLGSSNIPKQLKKHFLFVSKQSSDIVFRGIFKTSSVGDFFLIHNTFESSLNKFTDKTLKELNKIPITNYTIEEKINLAQEAKTKSLLFVEPSNFIKNTQINILSYDIYNKVDSFAIIECHLPIENKHSVFRAIYCIDIKKTKKNLDMPDMYRKDFRRHILNWVASFDTVLNRIEPKTVNNLFNYGDSILSIYGYKAALDSLISLEKFYTQKNDFQSKSLYYQVLMTFSSFIGDNLSSLKYEARTRNLNNNKVGNFPEHTQRIDAIDFILKKYSKESIIMINEAHNRGQTRDFTKRLLAKLYEKGFRFLAVEALDYKDSLMNKRKFPVTESGYYIKEPAFGQFIREALHLGFNLISYEDTSAYNPNIPFKEGLNIREKGQTQNILSVLKQYPD